MKNILNKKALLILLLFIPRILYAGTVVFFSPKGQCESRIVTSINHTKKSLDVAMYSLNNDRILTALENAKKRGVQIRILLDRMQARGNKDTTKLLKKSGFDFRVQSHSKIQHNKFAIFDNSAVETGSFNWTTPAQNSNEENCLFLDDPNVVKSYKDRFNDYLWKVNTEAKSKEYLKNKKNKSSNFNFFGWKK